MIAESSFHPAPFPSPSGAEMDASTASVVRVERRMVRYAPTLSLSTFHLELERRMVNALGRGKHRAFRGHGGRSQMIARQLGRPNRT